jgi:hypothetical protein
MTAAPIVYLVASVLFWVSAAYYRWSIGPTLLVEPDEGMILAATSWVPATIAGAAVYAAARLPGSDTASDPLGALLPAAKALAVALITLPFVLQGAPAVVAPRPVQVFAVATCNGELALGSMVDLRMAVQWVPSAPYGEVDWDESVTVAMVNGQGIAPLEVPPLLPDGYLFHRRYLAAGSVAEDAVETGQTFANEFRLALFRAVTLGASPISTTTVRAELEICSS